MTDAARRTRPVLVYDGDCGFCTSSVRFLETRIGTRAEVVAFQFADLASLGVTAERAEHEVLWVTPDGRVAGGAEAVGRLLTDAGGVWRVPGVAMRIPPVSWLAHAVYRLVANNRQRMPGGTAACALPAAQRPGATARPAS
ncbi:thiol-disulfide oxidoreductase DCC family protein [Actinomadura parmotrematis]|uniref:DUF393 domain-containing protein n=1 Tax=Actinomadura parmotrematis TaxID=2864039 RepID=A0ABS7G1D3_9ACTN|nr:DUF393 domain-containing protein [Actinomadura parmotrematis]MBW8486515.1 DUF393 domain-containing protein [Actinomadura parmotrematis]